MHVLVVIHILHGHSCHVGLDLGDVEEHLVDFLVVVRVGTAQLVSLSNSLLHFERVHDSKSDVVDKDGLDISVHALDLPHHAVEHLHVHAPFGSNGRVRVQSLDNVGGSKDGDIWVDGFDFLLADPLGAQTFRLRVGIGSSSGNVDEALDLRRVTHCFGNSHGHADVCLFKLRLLLVKDVGANT